jgi:hypothetical protein
MIIEHLSLKDRRLVLGRVEDLVQGDSRVAAGERGVFLANLRRLVLESPSVGLFLHDDVSKLGSGLLGFSLPAGNRFREATCPGASEVCESICYANKGRMPLHEWKTWVNWAFVLLWPERFVDALSDNPLSKVFRIHVGGDFFDLSYLGLWSKIVTNNPRTRFYAYTRSWQDGSGVVARPFVAGLNAFAKHDNVRLVLSCDRGTGVPLEALVPAAIRAWLSVDDQDVPPEPVELAFRNGVDSVLATMPAGSSMDSGTTVCPTERSPKIMLQQGRITCRDCGWCWGAAHEVYRGIPAGLSKFNGFAGQNSLPDRVKGMFRGFVPRGASLGAHGEAVHCTCGTDALCGFCGDCIECLCHCDISFGLTMEGPR